jgi:translation initiation factor 2 beta subunit (eIF-2beta)/eIF-5
MLESRDKFVKLQYLFKINEKIIEFHNRWYGKLLPKELQIKQINAVLEIYYKHYETCPFLPLKLKYKNWWFFPYFC